MLHASAAPAHFIAALLAFLASFSAAPVRAESFVDFLYIEPNEGGSSGGHAALRVDDRVYHFEHVSPGLLRLRRVNADAFVYAYGILGNRPIHVQRLALSDTAFARLRDTLNRRRFAQDAQFELRDALQRDVALFEYLRQRPTAAPNLAMASPRLQVPAAGLFCDAAANNSPDELDAATTLQGIAASIEQEYGPDFLAGRVAELHRRIALLPLRAATDCDGAVDADAFPRCADPISLRWQQLATAARGLTILREHRPLRRGSYQSSGDPDFRLSDAQVAALESQASKLESDLVDLVASSRPDWGFGFIIGMARLVTMRASAAQHRLIVAGDARAAVGLVASSREDARLVSLLPAIDAEVTGDWRVLLTSVLGTRAFREADYTALELAGQRVVAIRRVMRGWRPMGTAPLYPDAAVDDFGAWPAAIPSAAALQRAQALADAYDRSLARAYEYNLITRNCVTELTTLLEDATDAAQRAESSASIATLLGFIPFVATRSVAAHYTMVAEETVPSHRARMLAQRSADNAPWLVALRESNTLTARLYRPWSHDSTFLFFTSDAAWDRPLLGVTNLVVAAGASALGLLQLPLVGPHPFIAGVRGILYSLPELFFVNIRKGTFPFVPRDDVGGTGPVLSHVQTK